MEDHELLIVPGGGFSGYKDILEAIKSTCSRESANLSPGDFKGFSMWSKVELSNIVLVS